MNQRKVYGVVEIFKDSISYQQVVKSHTMLKWHGKGFPKSIPTMCQSNQ